MILKTLINIYWASTLYQSVKRKKYKERNTYNYLKDVIFSQILETKGGGVCAGGREAVSNKPTQVNLNYKNVAP